MSLVASLAIILGSVGGEALLGHARRRRAVRAYARVALLYLVTEELLTEAHKTADTNLYVIVFFVGFGFLFTVEGIA